MNTTPQGNNQQQNNSELAQLLQQIEAEFSSAQSAMSGFMQGAAYHKFMIARTENVAKLVEQAKKVGTEEEVKQFFDKLQEGEDKP